MPTAQLLVQCLMMPGVNISFSCLLTSSSPMSNVFKVDSIAHNHWRVPLNIEFKLLVNSLKYGVQWPFELMRNSVAIGYDPIF